MIEAAGGLYLGLISGTSADGIDTALCRFEAGCEVLAACTYAYPESLREALLTVAQSPTGETSLDQLGALDAHVGQQFAQAARELIEETGIDPCQVVAIGSHGQTLRHRPDGKWPFSLQIGDPARIAELTGITTVADFRRRDIAAGGQGAPLAPAFHAEMLSDSREPRAVLNIGGIANLTRLTPGQPVIGFDCGPGNALVDAWCQRHRNEPFDREGRFAAQGHVDHALLDRLMTDDYLYRPPPKSTGREHFHLAWLDAQLESLNHAPNPADTQATLLAYSARSIAEALHRWLPECGRVLICGGGWKNPALIQALRESTPGVTYESTAELGIDPDFVEAATFAWLARRALEGRPGNLPEVTGAQGPRILGAIHPA